jgi:valyl-tRNA synthetase
VLLARLGGGADAIPVLDAPNPEALEPEDRWMLAELAGVVAESNNGFSAFRFHDTMERLYDTTWHSYCDWYAEMIKPRLQESAPLASRQAAAWTAVTVLDTLVRLLHPFMPFVTEELWSRLPGERDFIMRAPWPEDMHRYVDGQAEVEFETLMQMVDEIRSYRKTIAGAPAKGGAVMLLESLATDWVQALALLGKVAVVDELPPGKVFALGAGSIVFPTVAAADPAATAKKRAELQKELDRVLAKLDNPEFRAKAPEAVVADQEARAEDLRAEIDRLE